MHENEPKAPSEAPRRRQVEQCKRERTNTRAREHERRRFERERAALAIRPRWLGTRLRPQRGAAAVPIRHPRQQYVQRSFPSLCCLFMCIRDGARELSAVYVCTYGRMDVNCLCSVQGGEIGGESDDDHHDPPGARRARRRRVPFLLDHAMY